MWIFPQSLQDENGSVDDWTLFPLMLTWYHWVNDCAQEELDTV